MCVGRMPDPTECVPLSSDLPHALPAEEAEKRAACQPEAVQYPRARCGLKMRERTYQRAVVKVVDVNVARTNKRHRAVQCVSSKRPAHFSGGKLPPSIILISLAALLSTTVQPAGNGHVSLEISKLTDDTQCPVPCGGMPCNASNWSLGSEAEPSSNIGEIEVSQEDSMRAESLLLNPNVVALLVRTAFILLELGSRPLKNAKKILSCGLICYWLLEYRYKLGSDGADGRGPPQRGSLLANSLDMSNLQPSWMIFAQNAPFIYSYLVLKLGLKMGQLINHFITVPKPWKKSYKRLRVVKLWKLRKLAKMKKIVSALCGGLLGVGLVLKTLKYLKLLKLLKMSRKCKRLLSKRHYKAFKMLKALKLLKVVRLALVVLCIESSVVPAGARSALQLPVCKLSWAAAG